MVLSPCGTMVKEEPKSRSPTPAPVENQIVPNIFTQFAPIPLNYTSLAQIYGFSPTEDNINHLAALILMLTNSTATETIPTHIPSSDVSAFRFDWNTTLKEEYDSAMEKLSSPQYTNLSSTSPSSSSDGTLPKVEVVVQNGCVACGYVIKDKFYFLIDNKCYHSVCIRCSMCDVSFESTDKCYVRDGEIYCRTDHAKRFQKCCVKCDVPLNRDDMVMKTKDMIFHHACFLCFICGAKLNPGDYYTMSAQGHLYCHAHYNVVRTTALCEERPATVAPVTAPEPPPREPSTEAEGSSDDDGAGGSHQRSKRMRTSFKHHQLRAMKTYFALNHNPDAKDLKQLAAKTNLTKRVLQVWFQNARAKYRRGLQENGRGGSPLCGPGPLLDMNPPLSSSSSCTSTDGFPLNTYSPKSNYTHL